MTKTYHSSFSPPQTASHSTISLPTIFDWNHLQTLDTHQIHQEICRQSRPILTNKDLTPYRDLLKLIKEHFPAFKMPATINLKSSDGVVMAVDKDVAERSHLIKNMIEDLPDESLKEDVPITNVNEAVLKKVIEWCTHHRNDPAASADDDSDSRKKSTEIEEWDQKFMQVDQEMLFEIILAANYLDIKPLLDVGCKTVANMIKGKSPEEIRKTFNIQNDFTPEEEDQIRRENEWAEDR